MILKTTIKNIETMKNATTIFSLAVLGSLLMSFTGTPQCKTECENLQIENIAFVEIEEEIDLGFDTVQYLPEGFDPYKGMAPNLPEIVFIESEEKINLGFDTSEYLPEGFNAYEGMMFDIDEIEYVEVEEEIDLNFEVQAYLPEDFNALSK